MNARLCDACKKVISEKEINFASVAFQRFELCSECKKKFDDIKEEYNNEEAELEKAHQKLKDKTNKKLKGIGIDYEKI